MYLTISRSFYFCSEFLGETETKQNKKNKTNQQTTKKAHTHTQKAAVSLDATFQNSVLYFASYRLSLKKKPKIPFNFFFAHCTGAAAMNESAENVVQPNNNSKRKKHLTHLSGMLIRVLS